ncbi:unnamed protein product [Cyclocybe aegerita]|uniref:Uncharacterized protein n=1 Tax=Cyclocybe aegerita TaxID=1973307 RepID=A0A8S0XJX8_CYCAE|nr:unnamed protein product [Cyclocybe aegerita]
MFGFSLFTERPPARRRRVYDDRLCPPTIISLPLPTPVETTTVVRTPLVSDPTPRKPAPPHAPTIFRVSPARPVIPAALARFFDTSRPAKFDISERHTASKQTRAPKFYDMHLHHALRLKHIIILDHLP